MGGKLLIDSCLIPGVKLGDPSQVLELPSSSHFPGGVYEPISGHYQGDEGEGHGVLLAGDI